MEADEGDGRSSKAFEKQRTRARKTEDLRKLIKIDGLAKSKKKH